MRANLAGDGSPGPIEIRFGRRLMQLIEPASPEGRALLVCGAVELLGPEGEKFGRVGVSAAWGRMRRRLEDRLNGSAASPADDWLRENVEHLRRLEASVEGSPTVADVPVSETPEDPLLR